MTQGGAIEAEILWLAGTDAPGLQRGPAQLGYLRYLANPQRHGVEHEPDHVAELVGHAVCSPGGAGRDWQQLTGFAS